MQKKIASIFMALVFLVSAAGVVEARFQCDVESIEGNRLVLTNCDTKGLKHLKASDTVRITKKRKKKAGIEGC